MFEKKISICYLKINRNENVDALINDRRIFSSLENSASFFSQSTDEKKKTKKKQNEKKKKKRNVIHNSFCTIFDYTQNTAYQQKPALSTVRIKQMLFSVFFDVCAFLRICLL